jgi:hypothetical protein
MQVCLMLAMPLNWPLLITPSLTFIENSPGLYSMKHSMGMVFNARCNKYFSYIETVSFIDGGNRNTGENHRPDVCN